MSRDAHRAVSAVLARVEKERVRELPATAGVATAAVGGWAKLGAEIESLFDVAYREACAAARVQPDVPLERLKVRAEKATAGQLARALRSVVQAQPGVFAKIWIRVLVDDLEHRPSALLELLEVRNRFIHPGKRPPLPAQRVERALERATALLRRVHAESAALR